MGTLPGVDPGKIKFTKTTKPRTRVAKEKLVFGQTFTDHMLIVDWHKDSGWAAPEIMPYGPMSIDPAASVFHYALECFEGMKAYKCADGHVRLFRPECNMERFCFTLHYLLVVRYSIWFCIFDAIISSLASG